VGRPRDLSVILESVNEEGYESLVSRKNTSAPPKKATHHGSAKPQGPRILKSTQPCTRSASVKVVEDEESSHCRNVGRPQDPSVILESVDDDEYKSPVEHSPRRKPSTSTKKPRKAAGKSVKAGEEVLQEDTDKAELGM
jgi:hypothetical protein